jgi:hypothetical protein
LKNSGDHILSFLLVGYGTKTSMQITDEQVEKYIALYFLEYGKVIDKAKAREELTALVCMLNAVYQHQNKENI